MRDISGEVAGTEYLKLAETPAQQPWLYTNTKDGGGYVDSREKDYSKTVDSDEKGFLKERR
jgi:hypothetical protein